MGTAMAGDSDSYRTLARPHSTRLKIERSEFISHGGIATDQNEVRAFIAAKQHEYRDATHNCFAYRIGAPGPEVEYFSDAGEPSGTAGRPILSVMKSNDLHNCVIVVTRYFGGRKLGVPGLIKAYSLATQQLIDEAGVQVCFPMKRIHAVCDYACLDQVHQVARSLDAVVEDRVFADKVELVLSVRTSQCGPLASSLRSLGATVTSPDDQLHSE
ncbi:MAG: YigZ family protein [Firmicutes bacterium]|nr:YigZ family protein [Bacillota bacterium]